MHVVYMYSDLMHHVAWGNSGDEPARLVHRGVGGSPRAIVQHARVVVQ